MLVSLRQDGDAPALVEELGIGIREAEIDDYAMLEKIDFEHPVLRPFSAPGLRDFTKIHFWRHRSLQLPDPTPESIRVLASFDSGDPAWLEIRVERGRIFLFTSNWVPQESQLALSSKFVPLLYSMMRSAGFESDARRQFYAGDPVPTPGSEAEVTHPDKTTSTGASTANLPGVYTIKHEGETLTCAVNVPFEESRLEPLLPEVFVTQGVTLAGEEGQGTLPATEAEKIRLETVELEAQQKFWKWLVLAAVIILLGETWLANGGWRRSDPVDAAQPSRA